MNKVDTRKGFGLTMCSHSGCGKVGSNGGGKSCRCPLRASFENEAYLRCETTLLRQRFAYSFLRRLDDITFKGSLFLKHMSVLPLPVHIGEERTNSVLEGDREYRWRSR